jgi:hypothetical protein
MDLNIELSTASHISLLGGGVCPIFARLFLLGSFPIRFLIECPWEGWNATRSFFPFSMVVEESHPVVNGSPYIILYIKLFLLEFEDVEGFISVDSCTCFRARYNMFPVFSNVFTEAALHDYSLIASMAFVCAPETKD